MQDPLKLVPSSMNSDGAVQVLGQLVCPHCVQLVSFVNCMTAAMLDYERQDAAEKSQRCASSGLASLALSHLLARSRPFVWKQCVATSKCMWATAWSLKWRKVRQSIDSFQAEPDLLKGLHNILLPGRQPQLCDYISKLLEVFHAPLQGQCWYSVS